MNQHPQSPPKRLRVAFLGGAYNSAVGRVHRIAVEMDQRFVLIGGCFSRDAEVNRASAVEYALGPHRAFASLDDLLAAKSEFDVLVLLTPTDQHEKQLLRCLDARVPVVCEKAMATSVAEAESIAAALEQNLGFLAVTYNYSGYPMLRELKAMVAAGRFGRVDQIHLEMPQDGFARFAADGAPVVPQDWRLRDGEVPTLSLDLGVHLHMIVRFLTDARPLAVVASAQTYGNFPVVDNVSCMVRFSGNITCNAWYSKTALGYRNGLKVRLFGSGGAAEWVQENPEILMVADRHGMRTLLDRAAIGVEVANQYRYTRFKAGHPAGYIEAFANYYYDVADALESHLEGGGGGLNPYVFGVEEAVEATRFFVAAARSVQTRSWVSL